jgi:glycerate kinase
MINIIEQDDRSYVRGHRDVAVDFHCRTNIEIPKWNPERRIRMKFVVAPDSFKESLSAAQVARTMAEAIRSVDPSAEIHLIPMADGGEGTMEVLVDVAQGRWEEATLTGPLGASMSVMYGIIQSNSTDNDDAEVGVLDAATVFGLTQVPSGRRDPYLTTSRGMGEWLVQGMDQDYRRFIVGLGGSATNDGGMGLLSALGVKFLDKSGKPLFGYGRDLLEVAKAEWNSIDPRIFDCEITIAGDVGNPLVGPEGASAVYGPQKGATPEQVIALDQAMERYADLVEGCTNRSVRDLPGAGAAGGVGFALLSVGARMSPGAEIIAEAAQLEQRLKGADFVLTGEGRSDEQTLYGKLPYFVAQFAKRQDIPTILISGSLGEGSAELDDVFAASFACVPRPLSLQDCLEQAERNLYSCTRNVVRLLVARFKP